MGATAALELSDNYWEAQVLAALEQWGDRLTLAAVSPEGNNVFGIEIPAYPFRDDLDAAVATLRRGLEGVPVDLIEVTADFIEVEGSDYAILGRVEYRFLDDPAPVISLTLGAGLRDEHVTISVTVVDGSETEARELLASVTRSS